MADKIISFRDLKVYQEAFKLQNLIFQVSKSWPAEEKFALTDQVRRSSRAVGANITEAWAKRQYPLSFLSKLVDSDGELQESSHWVSTAFACGYIMASQHDELQGQITFIGGKLGKMMSMPENFSPRAKDSQR